MTSRSDLTWTCHVCGAERADERISVHARSILIGGGRVEIGERVRYCNDSPPCRAGADLVSWVKPLWYCEDCHLFAKRKDDALRHSDECRHALALTRWALMEGKDECGATDSQT